MHRLRRRKRRPSHVPPELNWLAEIAQDEAAFGAWLQNVGEWLAMAVEAFNAFELDEAGEAEHHELTGALLQLGQAGRQMAAITAALAAARA